MHNFLFTHSWVQATNSFHNGDAVVPWDPANFNPASAPCLPSPPPLSMHTSHMVYLFATWEHPNHPHLGQPCMSMWDPSFSPNAGRRCLGLTTRKNKFLEEKGEKELVHWVPALFLPYCDLCLEQCLSFVTDDWCLSCICSYTWSMGCHVILLLNLVTFWQVDRVQSWLSLNSPSPTNGNKKVFSRPSHSPRPPYTLEDSEAKTLKQTSSISTEDPDSFREPYIESLRMDLPGIFEDMGQDFDSVIPGNINDPFHFQKLEAPHGQILKPRAGISSWLSKVLPTATPKNANLLICQCGRSCVLCV